MVCGASPDSVQPPRPRPLAYTTPGPSQGPSRPSTWPGLAWPEPGQAEHGLWLPGQAGTSLLIESKVFHSQLFVIGVDEVHLLCLWGLDFWPSYQQIGYVWKCFRDEVVMFGLSATLQKGKPFDTVQFSRILRQEF